MDLKLLAGLFAVIGLAGACSQQGLTLCANKFASAVGTSMQALQAGHPPPVSRSQLTRTCSAYNDLKACTAPILRHCGEQDRTAFQALDDMYDYICHDGFEDQVRYGQCLQSPTITPKIKDCSESTKGRLISSSQNEACRILNEGFDCMVRVSVHDCGEDAGRHARAIEAAGMKHVMASLNCRIHHGLPRPTTTKMPYHPPWDRPTTTKKPYHPPWDNHPHSNWLMEEKDYEEDAHKGVKVVVGTVVGVVSFTVIIVIVALVCSRRRAERRREDRQTLEENEVPADVTQGVFPVQAGPQPPAYNNMTAYNAYNAYKPQMPVYVHHANAQMHIDAYKTQMPNAQMPNAQMPINIQMPTDAKDSTA